MKPFEWNADKNLLLKFRRGIGFDDASRAILSDKLIATINHPNQQKYPGQQVFIVEINNYCYTIPFVESADVIFLKTVIPDRKATKKYLKKGAKYE
jgi:hypothetical protein